MGKKMLKIESLAALVILVLAIVSSWLFWQLHTQQLRFSNAIIPVMTSSSQLADAAIASRDNFHTSGYWQDRVTILAGRMSDHIDEACRAHGSIWLTADEDRLFDNFIDRARIAMGIALTSPDRYSQHDAVLSSMSANLSSVFRSRMNVLFWYSSISAIMLWLIIGLSWLALMYRIVAVSSIIYQAPTAIIVRAHRIVYANHEATQLLGNIIGKTLSDIGIDDDGEYVAVLTKPDGTKFCGEITMSAGPFVTVVFIRDITEKVKRRRERQDYLDKLQAVQTMTEALLRGPEKTDTRSARRKIQDRRLLEQGLK